MNSPTKTLKVLTAQEYPDGEKVMVFTSRTEIVVKAISDDGSTTICHFPKLRYGQKPQSQYQKNLTHALCFAILYTTGLCEDDEPFLDCVKRVSKIMRDPSNSHSLITICDSITEKFLGEKTTTLRQFEKQANDCAGWGGYIQLGIYRFTYDCHGQVWETEEFSISHKVSGRGKTMKSEHEQIRLTNRLICQLYNNSERFSDGDNYEEIATAAIEKCGWHASLETLYNAACEGVELA